MITLQKPIPTQYEGVSATHAKILARGVDERIHTATVTVGLYASATCKGEPIMTQTVSKYVWQSIKARDKHKPIKSPYLVELEAIKTPDEKQKEELTKALAEYQAVVDRWLLDQIVLEPAMLQAYGGLIQGLLYPIVTSELNEQATKTT